MAGECDCQREAGFSRMGVMSSRNKILSQDELGRWRQEARRSGKVVVVTNGCFDLLHVGHVTYLEAARSLGDLLLVGVNGDAAVRELKGPDRPVNSQDDRATVIAALGCVDAVVVFPEKRAARFLEQAPPDVYVKGGDYTLESLDQEERRVVEGGGGRIVLLPMVPGKSTSALLTKLART
jgi:D-glycero-beta-D-manno-heptose 1-phosphate adenylyltransferase